MSMYGMLFGKSSASGLLLAVVGLTEEQCGRFRDCYLTKDGEIAVYTRNGGGNRNCWHEDQSEKNPWGSPGCRGRSFQREEDEYTTSGLIKPTGRRVTVTRYVCEAPNSGECACPGCTIEYRLPAHPHYLRDEDDDFDSTYATVYFKVPAAVDRKVLEGVEPEMARDDVWTTFLDALQQTRKTPRPASR